MTDKTKKLAVETLIKCTSFISKFSDTHPVHTLLYKIDEAIKQIEKEDSKPNSETLKG